MFTNVAVLKKEKIKPKTHKSKLLKFLQQILKLLMMLF